MGSTTSWLDTRGHGHLEDSGSKNVHRRDYGISKSP
jgi:hypothetical protein